MIKHRITKNLTDLSLTFYRNLLAQIQRPDNFQNALLVMAAFISGLVAVAYAKLFKLSEGFLLNFVGEKKWLIFLIAPTFFVRAFFQSADVDTQAILPEVEYTLSVSDP